MKKKTFRYLDQISAQILLKIKLISKKAYEVESESNSFRMFFVRFNFQVLIFNDLRLYNWFII
jgi:hypothetical protein